MDGDHFAGVAGDAAVGEEVGRVGEDEVDGGFGDILKDFEAVALIDAEGGCLGSSKAGVGSELGASLGMRKSRLEAGGTK